ncbi:MAG: hypothetical protein ACJA16_005046 [Akkermansiaceae bacterium]|jgi:hypothetical protein
MWVRLRRSKTQRTSLEIAERRLAKLGQGELLLSIGVELPEVPFLLPR